WVIDGASNAVTSIINVGLGPFGVAVDRATDNVYVANQFSDTVSLINGETNTVHGTIISPREPAGVAVVPSTTCQCIFVADYSSNTVSAIVGGPNPTTTAIAVGTTPTGVAVDGGLRRAYVTNSFSNTVSVIQY